MVNGSLKIYLIAGDLYISAKEKSVSPWNNPPLCHTTIHNLSADLDGDSSLAHTV